MDGAVGCRLQAKVIEVVDVQVRLLSERPLADADHAHSRRLRGGEPRCGVFEGNAVRRVDTQRGGGLEKAVGRRLARADLLGCDQHGRQRQPGRPHPGTGQGVSGRGDERVRHIGQRREERGRAGNRDHPVHVRCLRIEQFARLSEVQFPGPAWEQVGHGVLRLPPVRDPVYLRPVESVARGPATPYTFDDGIGVHQGPVHVKQEGAGGKRRHRLSRSVHTGTFGTVCLAIIQTVRGESACFLLLSTRAGLLGEEAVRPG